MHGIIVARANAPSCDGTSNDWRSDEETAVSSSSFSTNYTMTNLVGAGRVLGNLYVILGRYLERILGEAAYSAGFGPDAIFERITQLYYDGWRDDRNKSESLQCLVVETYWPSLIELLLRRLCNKLLDHTKLVKDTIY